MDSLTTTIGLVVLLALPVRWFYSQKKDLSKKTILVTGAASGIGKAITLELIARGDFVVGSDISDVGLNQLHLDFPQQFFPLKMNVANAQSVREAAAKLKEEMGEVCLDAIVNNAGIMKGGPLTEMPDGEFEASLAVNVSGPFYVTKYFFPSLRRSGTGSKSRSRIINMGSEISYVNLAAAFNAPYAISKFGVEAISQSLRQEMLMMAHSPYVVVINPGAHATGMTQTGVTHMGKIALDSKFTRQFDKANATAQSYMDRHVQPASDVALVVADAVHLVHPPRRILVNVSLEMLLAKYTPQFVLDESVRLIFG